MEKSRGRVVAVNIDNPSSHAVVEVDPTVQCERCAAGKGCGAGVFGSSTGSRRIDAFIAAGLNVAEGDEVRIELASDKILQASLVVYGAPLSGAVVAALLAYVAGLGELYAVLAATAGMVAGLLLARIQLQKSGCMRRYTPTVVARIVDESAVDEPAGDETNSARDSSPFSSAGR